MSDLLSDEIKAKLPPLYSQEKVRDPIVHVHFYSTGSERWHWYILEGQQTQRGYIMFAWVVGWEKELGYVSLIELEAVNDRSIQLEVQVPPGWFAIPGPTLKDIIHDGNIVRDENWRPLPLSAVKRLHRSTGNG